MDSSELLRTLEKRIEHLEQKAELPKLMTPKQVCDFVGISESKFYEWKRDGDVPPAIYWSERTVARVISTSQSSKTQHVRRARYVPRCELRKCTQPRLSA